MLSRTRRLPARRSSALETLESRTLMSSGSGTLAEAMFMSSYASLHFRAASMASEPQAPRTASRSVDTGTTTMSPGAISGVAQVTAPEFTDAVVVSSDPDGTSAAVVGYRAVEPGAYTATARWDGGAPETVVLDQPGEFGNEPGVGALYARRADLSPGEHSLELTVTHAASAAAATTYATFTVAARTTAPDVGGGDFFGPSPAPDDLVSEGESATLSTAPAVAGVFFDSSSWNPAFRTYLANNGLGDAGFLVPAGSGQLATLPWSNVNRVAVRFTEPVTVAPGDLLLSGSAVTAYGFAAGGFTYNQNTYTATWTLDRKVPADKLRLQLRDTVYDADGERLDGEWADASKLYPSGDGEAGSNFNFRVNVLPGDANRSGGVNSNDEVEVRSRFFRSTTNTGTGTATPYTPFHDLDGSGSILATDQAETRKGMVADPLPADEPLGPPNPATPDPAIPLDGAPQTRTQYVRDSWGDAVKLRLDTRAVNSAGQSLATRTNDPVAGPAALRYTLLSDARNGGVELTPTTGEWTYTPRFDRSGPDRFRYNVTDGDATSHPADVVVETTRDPVYANDDRFPVGNGTEEWHSLSSVLENDLGRPVRGMDTLEASGGGATARGGTVAIDPDGRFRYTPPTDGLIGRDTFQYTMREDLTGKTASATVVLDGQPDPANPFKPVPHSYYRTGQGSAGSAIKFQTDHNRAVEAGSFSGLFDLYGSDPVYSVGGTEQGGTVTLLDAQTGAFSYAAPAGFAGWDSFTVNVSTSAGSSTKGQKVYVHVANYVPQAAYDEYSTPRGTPVVGTVWAIDDEGDPLKFKSAIMPAHGKLDLSDDGTFTYTPDANFAGVDAFSYLANDGIADGGLATVYFNVEPDTSTGSVNYVSIAATDPVATEGATPADPATFTISRTDTTGSLTVQYAIDSGLSTASSGDFQVTGTAQFGPGESQAVLTVVPNNDSTREWTETVVARLIASSGYMLYGPRTAVAEIVDTDTVTLTLAEDIIRANNDDDDDDEVSDLEEEDVSGEDDLVQLTLVVPQDAKEGAEITLAYPLSVQLWTTPNKTGKLQEGSQVWTVGRDTIPTTLWVEALSASGSMNDIHLTLSATDATAAQAPQNPTATQGTAEATNIDITLQYHGMNISGRKRSVVIGEFVNIRALISGPLELQQAATYQWNIPGNVLYDYDVAADGSTAHTIPVKTDNGAAPVYDGEHSGTEKRLIRFFNQATIAGATGPDRNVISVSVGNVGDRPFTADATFDIYSPQVFAYAYIGKAGINAQGTGIGLYDATYRGVVQDTGIVFSGTVHMPPEVGLGEGEWHFIQLVKGTRHRIRGGVPEHMIRHSGWSLDTAYPMTANMPDHPHTTAGPGWPTGDLHLAGDKPESPLSVFGQEESIDEQFQTWLMFRPLGATSEWVPVARADWEFNVKAVRVQQNDPGAWRLEGDPAEDLTDFSGVATYPEWDHVVRGDDQWEPDEVG